MATQREPPSVEYIPAAWSGIHVMACCICELLDRQNYSLYPLSLLLASGSIRRAIIDMRKTYARRPLMRLHKVQVIKLQ